MIPGRPHIDSPRLDLKQNPLYEEKEMAYCKTHYYGGSKVSVDLPFPWPSQVVVHFQGGTMVPVRIGEAPGRLSSPWETCCPIWPGDQAKRPWGPSSPPSS